MKVAVVVVAVVIMCLSCYVFPMFEITLAKQKEIDVNIIIESAKYIEIHSIEMSFAA